MDTPNAPNGASPIQVLVVDASEPAREALVQQLEGDRRIRVMHAVGDAASALAYLRRHAPDVVLMDHHVPGLDGFETTRRIMASHPLPIVVCSDVSAGDAVFRALEAGAVACVAKPRPGDDGPNKAAVAHLRQTVRLMSEVRVVRRWDHAVAAVHAEAAVPDGAGLPVVGIGASTGGPPVLQTIFAALPGDFPMPVMVVQHIARGFLPGMADWLRQTSGLKVQIAAHGMQPLPGHVYLAPDDFQMGLCKERRIELTRPATAQGLCPSVACLFRSLAEVCGRRAVGVLLTGMGKDGAADLKRLRSRGAVTIAQDQASSVVHGMPGEAIRLDAAAYVLAPDRIAEKLIVLAQQHARHPAGEAGLAPPARALHEPLAVRQGSRPLRG